MDSKIFLGIIPNYYYWWESQLEKTNSKAVSTLLSSVYLLKLLSKIGIEQLKNLILG